MLLREKLNKGCHVKDAAYRLSRCVAPTTLDPIAMAATTGEQTVLKSVDGWELEQQWQLAMTVAADGSSTSCIVLHQVHMKSPVSKK